MKNRLLILGALLLPNSAFALQVVNVVDGNTVPVVLSQKEVNRISMSDDSRIVHIWGAQNRMSVETDTDSGQLFVQAIGSKPFSVFIKADNGDTYTLLATPKKVPAETIFLRPPYGNSRRSAADRAMPYIKRIQRLATVLGKGGLPENTTPTHTSKVIPLWDEVHFKQVITYTGDTLIGEVYLLTNLTDKAMRLEEREFRGLPGEYPIGAVAIDKHQLKPQASTEVFVIRKVERRP